MTTYTFMWDYVSVHVTRLYTFMYCTCPVYTYNQQWKTNALLLSPLSDLLEGLVFYWPLFRYPCIQVSVAANEVIYDTWKNDLLIFMLYLKQVSFSPHFKILSGMLYITTSEHGFMRLLVLLIWPIRWTCLVLNMSIQVIKIWCQF